MLISLFGFIVSDNISIALKYCFDAFTLDKVAKVLHSGADFDTIIGKLSFQANGDLLDGAKIWVYQVKQNEFSQINWDVK